MADAARGDGGEANGRARAWAVVRVAGGNFLEMYDFMVFGYYAAAIGQAYFPSTNAFFSLMLALMTFGAGFLMRPLGAIVLGAYADRHGRRKGLLLTLSLMAVGIAAIAFTPGYATIGLFAPLIVLTGRLLQGFSAGMELGGVSVYLAEIAPPGRKGFTVSWQSGSQQVAVMVAAVIGVGLAAQLSPQQMDAWGWRVPLLFGCLLIPALFALRRSLAETEAFARGAKHAHARDIFRAVALNWRLVLRGMGMVIMTTVAFYMITAYTPTFGATVLHLTARNSLIVTLCVGLSNLIWLPIAGATSDRIGRRPLLIAAATAMLVSAYPAMLWLTAAPSFAHLLAVALWLSFLFGTYNGALIVALVEIMPLTVRTTGFAFAYSLATGLFGGFTPAVSQALIRATGNSAMPGVWLTAAAVVSLTACVTWREGGGGESSTSRPRT